MPFPEVPEAGVLHAVLYAIQVTRARRQRRDAIKQLSESINQDNGALDEGLAALGKSVRDMAIEHPTLARESGALEQAEERRARIAHECAELDNQQAEENSSFTQVESERRAKVSDVEAALERARSAHGTLQAQKRDLSDKLKGIDRQKRGALKAADERDEQAARAPVGDARANLRRGADDLRRSAEALDGERHELESGLAALEHPLSQAMATIEALQAELDAARRSLDDARDGHHYRLAEIQAAQSRKSQELSQADAELRRRLITLGTLVTLHRIDGPELTELYTHIDTLRSTIGARSTDIDRLTAESAAYDKSSYNRGLAALAALAMGLFLLIALLIVLL
jgi:DNA repair exonuclease SbcCD ATPase subunit